MHLKTNCINLSFMYFNLLHFEFKLTHWKILMQTYIFVIVDV